VRQPLTVLIVDDDEALVSMASRLLASRGIRASTIATSFGASNLVRRMRPDVVLLDIELPGLSGDALVALLRRSAAATTRIVLYSSHDEHLLRAVADRTGADGWISKSADIDTLAQYLTRVARLAGSTS
jgi:adenylate cyclase